MTIEYRTAEAGDIAAIIRAQSIGFGGSTADDQLERWRTGTLIEPAWRLCAFDDGEPVAQIAIVPVTMYWNGRTIGAAGVTDVFTLPTHRRRGILRELMTRAYAQMHEAGQVVTILEASMAAIYQRFGWAIVYTGMLHDFDPRHLRFVDEIATPGRVRLVRREAARAVIEPVYTRFAAERTLSFKRGDFEWKRALHLSETEMPPPLVAVYEEAGEVLGYSIYAVAQHGERRVGPDQRIMTRELIWLTPGAHRGLVQYFAGHDLVDSVYLVSMPLDDPLFYQADEPRDMSTRALDGALARIVDVAAALAGRGYDGAGQLTLGIEDRYAPWNSGTWELSVAGAPRVHRIDGPAQLTMTPRVLCMMLTGYQPASALERMGLIACADRSALAVADDLFRTARVPMCLDHWM